MKKINLFILTSMLSYTIFFSVVFADISHSEDVSDEEVQEFLNNMNSELVASYGANICEEYFEYEGLNDTIVIKEFLFPKDEEKTHIVYSASGEYEGVGTPFTTKVGKTVHRYLGYNALYEKYPHPEAPWDAGWLGISIENMSLVYKPWEVGNGVVEKRGIRWNDFDYLETREPDGKGSYVYREDPDYVSLEANIIEGLNRTYTYLPEGIDEKTATPQDYKNKLGNEVLETHQLTNRNRDAVIYHRDAKPKKGGDWVEYVHILQPPTHDVRGKGIVYFHGGDTYLGIPIAPHKLLKDDLFFTRQDNVTDKVEVGEVHRVRIMPNHESFEDLEDVQLSLYLEDMPLRDFALYQGDKRVEIIDGEETRSEDDRIKIDEDGKITIRVDGDSIAIDFLVPEDIDKDIIYLKAELDAGNEIEEDNEVNNVIEIPVYLINENIDLAVTDIKYDKYPANQEVSVVVDIANYSTMQVEDIPVYFEIRGGGASDGIIKVTRAMAPATDGSVIFNFTTPDANMTLDFYAEINPSRSATINEDPTKYGNNRMHKRVQIVKNIVGADCQPTRSWTETEDRWERVGTTPVVVNPITGAVSGGNPIYGWVTHYFDYSSEITSTETITPTTLKAGYGFEINVTSTVSYWQTGGDWIRDPDSPPAAPNLGEVYVSWDHKIHTMERYSVTNGGLTAHFRLPVNSKSRLGARKIYTNKDLKGTSDDPEDYEILIHICESYTPTGKLGNKIYRDITINGDMYEDDNTY